MRAQASWRIPGSPWWWHSGLEVGPAAVAAQRAFIRLRRRLLRIVERVGYLVWWQSSRVLDWVEEELFQLDKRQQ